MWRSGFALRCDRDQERLTDADPDSIVAEALELVWRLNGGRCFHIRVCGCGDSGHPSGSWCANCDQCVDCCGGDFSPSEA